MEDDTDSPPQRMGHPEYFRPKLFIVALVSDLAAPAAGVVPQVGVLADDRLRPG